MEDGEVLGQVFFGPLSQFGHLSAPAVDGLTQEAFRFGEVRGIEDCPNPLRHGFALIKSRDIRLRILPQVELTALPRHAGLGNKKARSYLAFRGFVRLTANNCNTSQIRPDESSCEPC